jgi:hypothetical protein
MAEVVSHRDAAVVIVLSDDELTALQYLLDHVSLMGTDEDEQVLNTAQELLDALDVEVVV